MVSRTKTPEQAAAVVRDAWLAAMRDVLVPVVRALLDRGVRYPDLVRLLGEAVVLAVSEDGAVSDEYIHEEAGVPLDLIPRLRGGREGWGQPRLSYAEATRLVSRWLRTPTFTERGRPRSLPLDGPGSFGILAEMAGVDAETALAALQASGVVRVKEGWVDLCKDAYVPSSGVLEMLDIFGRDGAEFLRMMIRNVESPADRAMFQRKASYDNIGSRALESLRETLEEEASRTLHTVDGVLAACDRDRAPTAPGGRRMRVSFGVYVAAEPVSERRKSPGKRAGRRGP